MYHFFTFTAYAGRKKQTSKLIHTLLFIKCLACIYRSLHQLAYNSCLGCVLNNTVAYYKTICTRISLKSIARFEFNFQIDEWWLQLLCCIARLKRVYLKKRLHRVTVKRRLVYVCVVSLNKFIHEKIVSRRDFKVRRDRRYHPTTPYRTWVYGLNFEVIL